jgi:hypothetical protein
MTIITDTRGESLATSSRRSCPVHRHRPAILHILRFRSARTRRKSMRSTCAIGVPSALRILMEQRKWLISPPTLDCKPLMGHSHERTTSGYHGEGGIQDQASPAHGAFRWPGGARPFQQALAENENSVAKSRRQFWIQGQNRQSLLLRKPHPFSAARFRRNSSPPRRLSPSSAALGAVIRRRTRN